MAWRHELAFWAAVALAGVIGVVLFKVLASKIPFTPLQQLAAAV